MQSSGRFGKKEKELSLFQIDAIGEWRGEQSRSFFIAKELARKGYPVQFVVQPDSPLQRRASEARLPILPVNMSSKRNLFSIFRLYRAMKRSKCQLVHFHDDLSVAVGSAAASLAKVSLRIASRPENLSSKTSNLLRRRYSKDIDAIIASSEAAEKDFVDGRKGSLVTEVIPFGVDFSPYHENNTRDYLDQKLGFDPDDFLVGIVLQLGDPKKIKYLIRATKYLREYSNRIKVVILGEGPLRIDGKKELNEIYEEDLSFYLGYREDSPQVFGSLDMFVCSADLEIMDHGMIEAMACQLPIVFVRVGAVPEGIKHKKTGLIVSPRSPKILANAVIRLFEDREVAASLGQKAFEFVFERFSAEAMAAKAIEIYEALANKRGVKLG
jgi:glycosyltransferase involved in cell wall biosynthesis